jgi:hypothetical protein
VSYNENRVTTALDVNDVFQPGKKVQCVLSLLLDDGSMDLSQLDRASMH